MKKTSITLSALASQMMRVHGRQGMVAFAFAMATPFSPLIRKYVGGFPLLYLYGGPATGKTSLGRAVCAMMSRPEPPVLLSALPEEYAKWMHELVRPDPRAVLMLEEATWKLPQEMTDRLCGFWDDIGRQRLRYDDDHRLQRLLCPLSEVLTGNDFPTNDALLTRMLVLHTGHGSHTRTKSDGEMYEELQRMIAIGYEHLGHLLLAHQPWVEDAIALEVGKARTALASPFDTVPCPERMVANITGILAVFTILEQFFAPMPFTIDELRVELCNVVLRQWEAMSTVKD